LNRADLAGASAHRLHAGIAEAGKLDALRGRHQQALARYREALRLARASQAPQVFGRHYLHCVLESLEHLSQHASVAEMAMAAAAATAEAGDTPFHRRDRAMLLERAAVAQLKAGDRALAAQTLATVLELTGAAAQPLAATLLGWLERGLAVDAVRLAEAQRRHRYWVVRADTVDRSRAIDAPLLGRELFHGR